MLKSMHDYITINNRFPIALHSFHMSYNIYILQSLFTDWGFFLPHETSYISSVNMCMCLLHIMSSSSCKCDLNCVTLNKSVHQCRHTLYFMKMDRRKIHHPQLRPVLSNDTVSFHSARMSHIQRDMKGLMNTYKHFNPYKQTTLV